MIDHQNIIKLYHAFKNQDYLFLVMEYCNGGSLHENLYDYKNKHGKAFSGKISSNNNEKNINRSELSSPKRNNS